MKTLQNENEDWGRPISGSYLEVHLKVYDDKQNTYIGTIQGVRHLISVSYDIIRIVNLQPYLWLANSERLMITTRIQLSWLYMLVYAVQINALAKCKSIVAQY